MEDLFKKVIYTGVGLISVTAEKLQSTVDTLVDENKISREEGRKVIDDLIQNTEGKREEFESQLKNLVEDVFSRTRVASQQDFDALVKRVEALEGTTTEEEAATEATATEAKKATPRKKAAPKKKEEVSAE